MLQNSHESNVMVSPVQSDDLHVDEFVRVLRTLDAHLPISYKYERD